MAGRSETTDRPGDRRWSLVEVVLVAWAFCVLLVFALNLHNARWEARVEQIRLGMGYEEVRALLGEPLHRSRYTEFGGKRRDIERWAFPGLGKSTPPACGFDTATGRVVWIEIRERRRE